MIARNWLVYLPQAILNIILCLAAGVGVFSCLEWTANTVVENRMRKAGQIETGAGNKSKPPDRITRLERRVESGLLHTNERIDKLYEIYFDERMRELKERLPPPQEQTPPQR